MLTAGARVAQADSQANRTATVRGREKIKGTDSLTVAVRNEASMLRECYRTATVRESVLVPIFSRLLSLRVGYWVLAHARKCVVNCGSRQASHQGNQDQCIGQSST